MRLEYLQAVAPSALLRQVTHELSPLGVKRGYVVLVVFEKYFPPQPQKRVPVIVCVWTLKGVGGGLDGAVVVGSGNISPSGNFLAFSDTAHLQSHFFVVLLRSTAGSAPRPGWPARRHSSLVLADLLYLLSPTSLTSKEP